MGRANKSNDNNEKTSFKTLIASVFMRLFGASFDEPESLASLRLQEQYRTIRFLIAIMALVIISVALILSGNAEQISNILGHWPLLP